MTGGELWPWLALWVLVISGCAAANGGPAPGPAVPDWKPLWDFGDPEASRQRFEALLPATREAGGVEAEVILLTQIARARGLGRDFAGAHGVLDDAAALLGSRRGEPRVRLLLERGRVRNSGGEPSRGRDEFLEALEVARACGLDGLAVDAAHMLGIVEPPAEAAAWNERALAMAEASDDPAARRWLGALLNNQGWTRHDEGRFEEALDLFRRALALRREAGGAREIRIARWTVARCLRSLGRTGEALTEQRAILAEAEAAGQETGYESEEIGECLLALGRAAEAKPHFRRAFDRLSKDPWLAANEKPRLARLESLAGD